MTMEQQQELPGSSTGTTTLLDEETTNKNILGHPYNVILFNDEENAYMSVVMQVQKATKCSLEEAERITHEAHEKGETVAFSGHKERCEFVDSILSGPPLKLRTDIRKS